MAKTATAKTKKPPSKPPKNPKAPPPPPEEIPLIEPTPADYAAIGIGENFTPKERKFIFYYTMPGPDFMNQTRAAIKAGYTQKNAVYLGYQVRRKPDIDSAIKNILNSST